MCFVLDAVLVLSLLGISVAAVDPAAAEVTLWGKMADFTQGCSHWRLRPDVLIPPLNNFTVCLHLQLQDVPVSPWTAFLYHAALGQWPDLGLGGEFGQIVVWLFGVKWIAFPKLAIGQWHYLCLTWSETTITPTLYVNGSDVDLIAVATVEDSPFVSSPRPRLIPNGTLTLGASHSMADGELQIHPVSRMQGRLSLFRLWAHARSRQEVMWQDCTEGDVVKWKEGNWDVQACSPCPDSNLRCYWSLYEIKLRFFILHIDGTKTDLYRARDIAHFWLRKVLPSDMYLHSLSVSALTGSHVKETGQNMWWAYGIDRFSCLAHINVIPRLDVAVVQTNIYKHLQTPYREPSGLLQVMVDPKNIYTNPIGSFPGGGPSKPTVSNSSAVTASMTSTTTSKTPSSTPSRIAPTTPTPTRPKSTSRIIATYTSTATCAVPATTAFTAPSELYYEVQVNVSITGDCNPETFLSIWLNTMLPNNEMMVLNFQVLSQAYRLPSNQQSNISMSEVVQVVRSQSGTMEAEHRIRYLLELPYNSSSVTIATQGIQISRILIVQCEGHTHQTIKGLFKWPATKAQNNATQPCPGNHQRNATRHCKLCLSTHWMSPDLDQCPPVVETIPDLNDINVTPDNAGDVVVMIEHLLSNQSTLSFQELQTVLNMLKAVVHISAVTQNLGLAVINVISDVLESDSDLQPFTNTILNITEAVGDKILGYNSHSALVAPAVALSVVDVFPGQFDGLTFSVSSAQGGLNPEIHINKAPFNGTVAFISLPSVLEHSFPQTPPRIQFQFYAIPMLFKSTQNGRVLNTFVVSASVTNASSPITELVQDVSVTLHHLTPNTLNRNVQCVYWNFNDNGGHGGWDGRGCKKDNTSVNYTACLCDHLTHFGVLLDVSRTEVDPNNQKILTIVTYLGCGLSSLFLGVTVLTYTAFEKLRRDYPSKILINLSLALLGLNLVFMTNSWLASWHVHGLCVAVASMLHYFLLASFTWMGLEAVNMYLALVKVFNVYVPSYMLKFCALGWGLPLVVCLLVLVVDREAYGAHLYTDTPSNLKLLDNSDDFCWLQDDVAFYVSVVGYTVMVFLFNTAVFVVVLIQIRHMRANRPAGIRSGLVHDLKGVASLTLLLGLTWVLGLFTWGPARMPLLYLFSGLNSLQGLFIFLFHCLMKENVRKQWRIHLCFGRFRLGEYSEWSHTASVGAVGWTRPTPPEPLALSVRSVKSSATDSTSASSESGQRDLSTNRPNLALLVDALAVPRAPSCQSTCKSSNPTHLDQPH